jgi:hypothetical protein
VEHRPVYVLNFSVATPATPSSVARELNKPLRELAAVLTDSIALL